MLLGLLWQSHSTVIWFCI